MGLCRNGNELFVTGIGQVFGKRSNEIVCSDRALLDRISNGNRLIAHGDGCNDRFSRRVDAVHVIVADLNFVQKPVVIGQGCVNGRAVIDHVGRCNERYAAAIACREIATVLFTGCRDGRAVHAINKGVCMIGISVIVESLVNLVVFGCEYGNGVSTNDLTERFAEEECNLTACELCGGLGAYAIDSIRFGICKIVAVRYGAHPVVTNHAADIFTADDRARIVAVRYVAVVVATNHAADIALAADIAHVVAVPYGAAVVVANHAADIAIAADSAHVVAVLYGAVVVANHAAGITTGASDSARVVAVLYGAAASVFTNHAADISFTTDIRIHNAYVLDGRTV